MASLDVYLFDEKVGVLTQKEGKANLSFKYLDTASQPISLALPLQKEVFTDEKTRGFFESLLPEGDIRKAIAKARGVSSNNPFALLRQIGGECAGAISLHEKGTLPDKVSKPQPITVEYLIEKLKKSDNCRIYELEEKIRFSLAGAQDKVVLTINQDDIYIPTPSFPSNVIIKPENLRHENVVYNENYCMRLAFMMGFNIPPSFTYVINDCPFYIVSRYDREMIDGKIFRLHQEDFCQVLSLYNKKYQEEGGPSIKTCFDLIGKYSVLPIVDKIHFLRIVIYNFIIGNSDAHGKNFSFLYTDKGIRLAPFYDLLSTQIYDGTDKGLSMKIGGEYNPDLVTSKNFVNMAKELDIKEKFILELVDETLSSIISNKDKVVEMLKEKGKYHSVIEKIKEIIDKRIGQLS